MSLISNQNWLGFTNYYDDLGKRMRGFQVELRNLHLEQIFAAEALHGIESMHGATWRLEITCAAIAEKLARHNEGSLAHNTGAFNFFIHTH